MEKNIYLLKSLFLLFLIRKEFFINIDFRKLEIIQKFSIFASRNEWLFRFKIVTNSSLTVSNIVLNLKEFFKK